MEREQTWGNVMLVLVAFAASAATLSCAFVALFDDRETLSAVFALGGLGLALWSALRALERA
jgi:hypothetical protein